MSDQKETLTLKPQPKRQQSEKKDRRRRQEIDGSLRGKLGIDMSKLDTVNFHYRWVENSPERLSEATVNDDYDLVPHDDVHATNGDDSYVRRNGGEFGMVLARKPKEFFDADQKAKSKSLDKTDEYLKGGGAATEQIGQANYKPAESIKFTR